MPKRFWIICGLFTAEAVLIVLAFQVLAPVECRLTGIETACRTLRGAAVRGMCLGTLLAVYLWAVPAARISLARIAAARVGGGRGWALVHVLAMVVVFAPLLLVAPEQLNMRFAGVFAVLTIGGMAAVVSGLFWLAAPAGWAGWLRARVGTLVAIGLVALVLPGIAALIGPLWYWGVLTKITFAAVAAVISAVADEVLVLPEMQVIGTNGFAVAVADSCSGVEGFALIAAFMGVYAWLFRDSLRMVPFWGIILPVALMLSWALNVLRIAALVLIGAHVSPGLAQNGFHSFAGWLFFMVLAFGVLLAADRLPWLRRPGGGKAAPVTPLAEDEVATRIVPFVVFMVSGVIVQAFWATPALAFPLQAAAMAVALWWGRRAIGSLLVRPDAVAVLAGAAVGIGWVWTAPAPGATPAALLALSPVIFVLWAGIRIAGTALLVPMVEELFFRGYVQQRLDGDGWARRVLAIAASSALFAALHGRYVAAGVAGVIFALVYLRRGRLVDAIAAHAVANALIAGVAAWRGDWGLI